MAPRNSLTELSVACKYLRSAAPEQFQHFLKEFRLYSDTATRAMVEASSDTLFEMQGHARQCLGLLRIFEECDKTPTP